MDVVVDLVAAASADSALESVLDGRIYGYVQPEGAPRPFIVITATSIVNVARPTRQWKNTLAVLNIHSEDAIESNDIATLVDEFVPTFVGIHDSCVVQDSQVESIQPVTDDGWTPIRFRNVVTVDLTAREPKEGEAP